MTDELLPYYERELAYVRKLGAEFAAAHPKIAGRLRMSGDRVEDPHVSRLIEAFAYLNARTRWKLDDEFPEITESILGILYPHYLAPFPSSCIVRFVLDRGQADLTDGYTIKRHARLETEPIEGEPCRFRTCYPVTVWPLQLSEATYAGHPLPAPPTRFSPDARAVAHLRLNAYRADQPLSLFSFDKLRFFLNGETRYIYDLYEALLNHTLGIAIATSEKDQSPVTLPADAIQPVGFARDQGLLEYSAQSFLGYRLLSEFFMCPEKFLFVDIEKLTRQARSKLEKASEMHLFIYFRKHSPDLERNITEDSFQLGCAPMVNLFRQRAEPIQLTHHRPDYRVIPDARRPLAYEVYSVDRVTVTSPDNVEEEYAPFFSIRHGGDEETARRFYHPTRRTAEYAGGQVDDGTEVYLNLVDLDFDPSVPEDWTMMVETTCLNRDLPSRLPFGGGQPRLQLATGGPLESVGCMTPPRKTVRPEYDRGTIWRLISHLSLNHLSLSDNENGAEAIREILRLYDWVDSAESHDLIEGLLNVKCDRIVGRAGAAASGGFCRGLQVKLHFDEEKYAGSGVFLFASVLDRFLGLYCSMNSFTQTVATTTKREGNLHKWRPRAGEQVLL